ncbi:NlpC/P60 family protein [Pontibacter sp. JAM-7]|uniref:NlpC/P60 family protein n=1 Tax=Pontibacter sp. JAM-7 TaxID=3366581 RepID=UPI003AF5D349
MLRNPQPPVIRPAYRLTTGLLCTLFLVGLSGCATSIQSKLPEVAEQSVTASSAASEAKPQPSIFPTSQAPDIHSALVAHFEQWRGAPYRLGGQSKQGVDCSGFMQLTFAKLFNLQLPRTTQDQARTGWQIKPHLLTSGDLVFFRTGWRRQRHVGVYLQDQVFLHASTSRGVMLSRLDNPYWAKAFWKAMRPAANLQLAIPDLTDTHPGKPQPNDSAARR